MHTRGEWTIPEPFEGQGKVFVWSDDGDANGEDPVAMCDGPDREANAARIVAMHAACAGVERLTPGLVAELVNVVKGALPLIEHAEHCEASAVDNMSTRLGHLRRLLSAARAVLG